MAQQRVPRVGACLLALLSSSPCWSYTLLETENTVLDKNYLYHSFTYRQQVQRDKKRALNTDLLPDVTLSHTTTRPYGEDDPLTKQESIFEVKATLNKSVNYKIDETDIRLEAKLQSQRELLVKYQLMHLVRSTYYELKLLEEQQALREANVEWLKQVNSYSQPNSPGAASDRALQLRAQLAAVRQTSELEGIYFRQQRASYTLKNLLRLEPKQELQLSDPLPQQFVFPFPFDMKFTPSELAIAKLIVDKTKNELNREYTSEIPNFFAAYQGISYHDDSSTKKQFLIGATWQIKPKAFFEVFAKKAEILAVEHEADDKKEAIARSVENVIDRLKTLQSQMIRQAKIIEVQERIVEGLLPDFKRGAISAKDYHDDIYTLFSEKNRLLEQRYETVLAFADFARLVESNDLFYKGLNITKPASSN